MKIPHTYRVEIAILASLALIITIIAIVAITNGDRLSTEQGNHILSFWVKDSKVNVKVSSLFIPKSDKIKITYTCKGTCQAWLNDTEIDIKTYKGHLSKQKEIINTLIDQGHELSGEIVINVTRGNEHLIYGKVDSGDMELDVYNS